MCDQLNAAHLFVPQYRYKYYIQPSSSLVGFLQCTFSTEHATKAYYFAELPTVGEVADYDAAIMEGHNYVKTTRRSGDFSLFTDADEANT